MASSYENTKMPEKPEITVKPDAIPVDDKGQPLPDPTEDLSSYLAPKGIEELRKAYSDVEEDEDVKETMEPPQRANLMRRFKGARKGYDFYGTPAKSIPNDNNGTKPSPLTELFSEAEALESDFDIDKIKEHVLSNEPLPGSEFQVVETPKLSRQETLAALQNENAGKSPDETLRRTEVIKDPDAPKFLEMYKKSTNTRVIYQDGENGAKSGKSASDSENAEAVFAEHSRVSKAKKKISKKENKKAVKAQIKAEKAAAKARAKAKRKGGADAGVTSPEEIAKLRSEAAAETKAAREEAARLRAELERMKSAAAQALDERQAQEDSTFIKKYGDEDF